MSRPRYSDRINADFESAIDELVAEGRDLNFSSVARRAGHSRSLISRTTTSYSNVRNRISELELHAASHRAPPAPRPAPSSDVRGELSDLRDEVRSLSGALNSLRSALAANVASNAEIVTGTAGRQLADLERRRAGRAARLSSETLN
jgi:hypothetical protein